MPSATKVEYESETRAKFRVFIKGTIDAVWHEITRTDSPIPAFFNSQMHTTTLAPGARIAMRTPNGKYTGVVGEVLEFNPPNRFVHTFRFTNYDDPECTMIFDLEEADGGVNFTLTIADLPVGTKSAKQMLQGGTLICNTLKSVIETGKPSRGTRLLFLLFKVMTPLSPKKCLSENWPVS